VVEIAGIRVAEVAIASRYRNGAAIGLDLLQNFISLRL